MSKTFIINEPGRPLSTSKPTEQDKQDAQRRRDIEQRLAEAALTRELCDVWDK